MSALATSAEEDLHWLALRLVPGLGARKSVPLVEKLRSPQAVFRCSRSQLEAAGLSGSVAQTIASGCTFEDAVDQQQRMKEQGVTILPFLDPLFPRRLRELYDPPLLLFTRGRLELLNTVMLGVVGTRRPTQYGVAATERLASELAAAGLTIVSGMARGIDTVAHKAALKVGGNTIAVFGCGIDVVYPAENRALAAEISSKGLLLSEYPLGAPGHPQNFPVRNRIISGVSIGVLISEAAQYSGSAITAQLALEQGRDVFAIPGNITSKTSWGTNLLIKQGAKLVQSAEDVLSDLAPEDRRDIFRQKGLPLEEDAGGHLSTGQAQKNLKDTLGPNTAVGLSILKVLQIEQPIHIDELMEKVPDCSSSEVIAVLFELELLALVRQLPGKNFVKVW
ncbi:MAG: DNA-protecting protein DprA [Acidobacteriia bacterium]|nr:DNA-protecting protein DprA [Terriglobia bacterium]